MFSKKYYLTLISLSILSNLTYAETLYKWVDNDGNITYQDSPPPENSELLEEKHLKNRYEPLITNNNNDSRNTTNTKPIIVYTTDNCSACKYILFQLNNYKIPYREENLNNNRVAQTILLNKLGNLTAPTILIDDQYFTNLDEEKLKNALRNADYQLNEETKKEISTPEPETNY